MSASRLVTVLVTTIAAGLGLAAPFAHGSRAQRSFFEDDRQLLWSGRAARDQALDEIRALGADTVHVLVVWNRLAPSPDALKRPAVDPADPSAYSGWDAYDGVVS